MINPKKEIGGLTQAYLHGYDCGKNGPHLHNCHFSIFSTPEKTKDWERGKANAELEISKNKINQS